MRQSRLTPAPVILDSSHPRFSTRLVNACSSKLNKLHEDSASGMATRQIDEIGYEHGWTTTGMSWPPRGEEPVGSTIILDDKSTAKRAAQWWAREKEVKVGAGVWMWWPDGSCSDNARVGEAAVQT